MPDGDDANSLRSSAVRIGVNLAGTPPRSSSPSSRAKRRVHGRPPIGAAHSGTQVGHQVQDRRLLSPQSETYQVMRLTSVVRLMVEQMSEHLMERLRMRCATGRGVVEGFRETLFVQVVDERDDLLILRAPRGTEAPPKSSWSTWFSLVPRGLTPSRRLIQSRSVMRRWLSVPRSDPKKRPGPPPTPPA